MSRQERSDGLERWLPILRWLPDYGGGDLLRDLPVGVLLAVLLIPQATAYAQLAGVPEQAGLWAATVAPMAYLALGSSRFIALGPVALVSVLVGETVGRDGGLSPVDTALVLAAATGLFLVLLGVFRLGFLIHFISQPVLTGFISAAALLIAATQMEHLLGLPLPGGQPFHRLLLDVAARLGEIHPETAVVGGSALLVLLTGPTALRRLLRRTGVPSRWSSMLANGTPLLLLVAGAAAAHALSLSQRGVELLDDMEVSLPPFTPIPIRGVPWADLLPTVVALAAVAFVTAMAIARSLACRRRQALEPNRELIALGAANLAASLCGGYPVGASASRSAVVFESGGRSPLAAVAGSVFLLLLSAPLAPLLSLVPRAVLAAVVCAAAANLLDVDAFRRVWRYRRAEAVSMAVTALAVLTGGLITGIAVGTAAGIVLHLWSTSRPRVVRVGRMEDGNEYRSLEREETSPPPAPVCMLRIDESLYFANVQRVQDTVMKVSAEGDDLRFVILDLRAVNDVDASALETLNGLADDLAEAGIDLCVAELKRPVQRQLDSAGFLDRLGPDRIFLSADDGVEALGGDGGEEGPDGDD